MKLSFEQIKQIITGVAYVDEKDGSVFAHRFTREQEELYKSTDMSFYNKCLFTSGVRLVFKTDSESLYIKINGRSAGTRKYFSLDVFADGKPVGYMDNFSDIELPRDYTQFELPIGEKSQNFRLGQGTKTVCVYMPWSVSASIEEISVDDGAFVEGIKPYPKLLVYGDSITQGYDALRPSARYGAILADRLGAEEINKGIGGERFFPELAELKDDFVPDYITVAYGTNDWSGTDEETFKTKCRRFYANLSRNYPDSKIFAITPIWRKDMHQDKPFGDFKNVENNMLSLLADIDNVTVISGFDLVPQNENYFADLRLHPNDEGFGYYSENLYAKLKEYIIGNDI